MAPQSEFLFSTPDLPATATPASLQLSLPLREIFPPSPSPPQMNDICFGRTDESFPGILIKFRIIIPFLVECDINGNDQFWFMHLTKARFCTITPRGPPHTTFLLMKSPCLQSLSSSIRCEQNLAHSKLPPRTPSACNSLLFTLKLYFERMLRSFIVS